MTNTTLKDLGWNAHFANQIDSNSTPPLRIAEVHRAAVTALGPEGPRTLTAPQGTGEIAVIVAALIGSGLGFLWYNAPPAAVFMGDTGSLSLGGALGAIAVATKHEIVLAIIGGLFVVEALSVIIQVGYFKMTGKRVFLMAPIHHHFEQRGWGEAQIVIRFWIISVILALIGLATLKLR